MKVRVKFSKTGVMKYIGHLDVMRYFQKALRRAGFDTALSGGFSPHMIMSFAAPLGVGITSDGEYFDLELNSLSASAEMQADLNAVMAEGISVRSVLQIPDDKKYGGMRLLAAADYLVRTKEQTKAEEAFQKAASALPAFLEQEEIPVEKKTKKGSRILNIRPLIYRMEAGKDQFALFVSQGSTDNLRPEFAVEALYRFAGEPLPEQSLQIHRVDMYATDGEGGANAFRTLESFGQIIH